MAKGSVNAFFEQNESPRCSMLTTSRAQDVGDMKKGIKVGRKNEDLAYCGRLFFEIENPRAVFANNEALR